MNFNPHSPCGERQDNTLVYVTKSGKFQSTLPVWGATMIPAACLLSRAGFQSTLPVWGATSLIMKNITQIAISIHTPRVGSDTVAVKPPDIYFQFQSTLPVWGATFEGKWIATYRSLFQSTLPVWGATRADCQLSPCPNHFNPHSPCGERPPVVQYVLIVKKISIHTPRVGSDH